jgi:hypothetical protein
MSIEINVINEIVQIDETSEVVQINASGGIGVPSGGLTNQVLAKNSNTNYDFKWTDNSASVYWGQVSGTLSNQTDLQNALNLKVPTSRTITINGVSQDLSANRTYTIDALPSQTGNSGKYLTTNGTIASWGVINLTGYVPYTGATGGVNLGAFDLVVQGLTIGKGTGALANNTALGYQAIHNATTGNFNTGVGYQSLHNISTGNYNTALGQSSMFTATTAAQNVAIGLNAMLYTTSGGSNVVVGVDGLQHNTTGASNVALGYNAGSHITGGATPNTTASNSVFIGRDSKALADGQTNQIVIGHSATGLGSNTTIIGNASTITSAIRGRLLLGTTTDTGLYQLDVNGTARVSSMLVGESTLGQKLEVFRNDFGLGIQSGQFQIITGASTKISLGQGPSASFTSWLDVNNSSVNPLRELLCNDIINSNRNVGTWGDPTAGGGNGLQFSYFKSTTNNYGQGVSAAYGLTIYDAWYQVGATNGGGFRWYQGTTEIFRTTLARNFLIGTNTDAGFKLDVNGTGRFVGALTCGNGITITAGGLSVTGAFIAGTTTLANFQFLTSGNASSTGLGFSSEDSAFQFQGYTAAPLSTYPAYFRFRQWNNSVLPMNFANQGIIRVYNIGWSDGNVNDVAGNSLWLQPIYNFAGSRTGIKVRGFYYDPVLTSLTNTTHIAIETRSGDVLLGTTSGSVGVGVNTTINASAIVDITSTTKGFLPPRMTTTQINAIATPAEGLIAYNTTISHLCVYQAGAWVKINHSPM